MRDVEQQLAGIEVPKEGVIVQSQYSILPAQKKLADAIVVPPGLALEAEICRRNRAIRAVTEYCGVEEGGMNPTRAKRRSVNVTPPAKSQIELDEEALSKGVGVQREEAEEMLEMPWQSQCANRRSNIRI